MTHSTPAEQDKLLQRDRTVLGSIEQPLDVVAPSHAIIRSIPNDDKSPPLYVEISVDIASPVRQETSLHKGTNSDDSDQKDNNDVGTVAAGKIEADLSLRQSISAPEDSRASVQSTGKGVIYPYSEIPNVKPKLHLRPSLAGSPTSIDDALSPRLSSPRTEEDVLLLLSRLYPDPTRSSTTVKEIRPPHDLPPSISPIPIRTSSTSRVHSSPTPHHELSASLHIYHPRDYIQSTPLSADPLPIRRSVTQINRPMRGSTSLTVREEVSLGPPTTNPHRHLSERSGSVAHQSPSQSEERIQRILETRGSGERLRYSESRVDEERPMDAVGIMERGTGYTGRLGRWNSPDGGLESE